MTIGKKTSLERRKFLGTLGASAGVAAVAAGSLTRQHARGGAKGQARQEKSLPLVAIRDTQGRFLTGNSGGGRRKGSRNKLTERFLNAIADDFAEHGAEAIAKVRTDDPASYLKILSSLVPRELIMQREEGPSVDYGELTYEELVEVLDHRRRQKYVEELIETIDRMSKSGQMSAPRGLSSSL